MEFNWQTGFSLMIWLLNESLALGHSFDGRVPKSILFAVFYFSGFLYICVSGKLYSDYKAKILTAKEIEFAEQFQRKIIDLEKTIMPIAIPPEIMAYENRIMQLEQRLGIPRPNLPILPATTEEP